MTKEKEPNPRALAGRNSGDKPAANIYVRELTGHISRSSGIIPEPEGSLRTREDIAHYKEALVGKLREIAALKSALKNEIKEGKIPTDEAEFAHFSSPEELRRKGIPDQQISVAQQVLNAYHQRRKDLNAWKEMHGSNPKKMFAARVGKEATGEISLFDRNLCFELMCGSRADFDMVAPDSLAASVHIELRKDANASVLIENGLIITESQISVDQSTYEAILGEAIDMSLPALRDHEWEHAWQGFLRRALLDKSMRDARQDLLLREWAHAEWRSIIKLPIEKIFGRKFNRNESRAIAVGRFYKESKGFKLREDFASELLSHVHQNISPWDGGYMSPFVLQRFDRYTSAYIEKMEKKSELTMQKIPKMLQPWFEEIDQEVYMSFSQDAMESIHAVYALLDTGLDKDEVAALLTLEPLERWPKLAKRFGEVLKTNDTS